jgi:membrane-bound serine protease (ClpP class)
MRTILCFFSLFFFLVSSGMAVGRDVISKGDVIVVSLHGEISSSLALFLRRAEKTAESQGAAAIIFDMDTYGGRLDSAEEITRILNHATIPTYTYINSNAGSAGSLIALATQHIFMAPVSAIGAAAPILSTGEDLPPTMKEKTVSYWSAFLRGTALRNGHNPDIAEAFMNKEKEVKIGNRIVHSKGALLTLNAQEATEIINGKPLLADGVADSIEDLMQKTGLKGDLVQFEPSGFEQLAFWLTTLAPLLLLGGIIGAYLEFKIPGFGLAGVVSAICFALFFLGHYFAGLAGWEVVALFVLGVLFGLFVTGVLLVLIEVLFFAHSTVIFGVVGVLLVFTSLLWAMIDRYPGQTFFPSGNMLKVPLLNLCATLLAAAIIIVLLAKYLPQTSIYRRIVLSTTNPPGPSLAGVSRAVVSAVPLAPGMRGRSLTILRPSGKAQFDDRVVDVVTEGEFIPPETPVAVISADGMRVVVRGVVV